MFVSVPSEQRRERAFAMNLGEVAADFRRMVGDDGVLRKWDAVLLKVRVSDNGMVNEVRAVKPRVFRIIPRFRPALFDSHGRLLEQVRWLDEDRLLVLATRAASGLRFAAARVNGRCVATTAVIAMSIHLEEHTGAARRSC